MIQWAIRSQVNEERLRDGGLAGESPHFPDCHAIAAVCGLFAAALGLRRTRDVAAARSAGAAIAAG
jgi:hypothetical protein